MVVLLSNVWIISLQVTICGIQCTSIAKHRFGMLSKNIPIFKKLIRFNLLALRNDVPLMEVVQLSFIPRNVSKFPFDVSVSIALLTPAQTHTTAGSS